MSSAKINREMLADALPDLVVLVQRDGIMLAHFGGGAVEWLRPAASCDGEPIESVWPAEVASLILQLTRRAIATRKTSEAALQEGARRCELRVTAHSPTSAVCVIRALPFESTPAAESGGPLVAPAVERRGFVRRFKNSISVATLNERPLAVAIIQIDGLVEIARMLDAKTAEQAIATALRRIDAAAEVDASVESAWYIGQFAENVLVVVLEKSDRDHIETQVKQICASLREPVSVGDAQLHLAPYAGVAILGRDASTAASLIDHARTAAAEARRTGSDEISFFSDTVRLRSLARLDVARELRDAIAAQRVGLRYVGRHDLSTGHLVGLVGYVQWIDPFRGEVKPADFLGIAEATGLSSALSQSLLSALQDDFVRFQPQIGPDVRVSFGALRHHVLSDSFVEDIKAFLADGRVPAERLELRVAERSYVSRDVRVWRSLVNLGIRLVVDEFGRQLSSLDMLARVPLWGLQLDRSWVTAVDTDPAARKVCGAIVGVANALGLTPIATGIDSAERRAVLLALGCRQGLGDIYAEAALAEARPPARVMI